MSRACLVCGFFLRRNESNVIKAFDLALPFFAACNGLRLVGYVPQILRVARDEGGASAVSCATWGLFALANVSTVLYAALVAADLSLALVFCANTLGSALIFGLTLLKRHRHIRVQRLNEAASV